MNSPPHLPSDYRCAPGRRPRVLMLTHRFPYPPDRGDRIRSYHQLRTLSPHCEISLACASAEPISAARRDALRPLVARLAIQPVSDLGCRIGAAAALLTGRAGTPSAFYRKPLARTIVQWHEDQPFDAVLTFCTGMVRYARHLTEPQQVHSPICARPVEPAGERDDDTVSPYPWLPPPRPRHVLDLVDVDSLKWEAYAQQARGVMRHVYAAEARRLQKIEAGEFDHYDAVTVISNAEAAAYRNHVGNHPRLAVVGNGVDIDYFHPLPDADNHTLCFVGVLDYPPNVQAVRWFAREVMPMLRGRIADAKLLVVGRDPAPAVRELDGQPGVEVIGPVDDVRDSLRAASVVVTPLQVARGVQNKVLEAMASRRAVVCSPQAFEGIDAEPERDLVVAEHPRQWAERIEQLLTNTDARTALARRARAQVEQAYAWSHRLAPMIELLGAIASPILRAAG